MRSSRGGFGAAVAVVVAVAIAVAIVAVLVVRGAGWGRGADVGGFATGATLAEGGGSPVAAAIGSAEGGAGAAGEALGGGAAFTLVSTGVRSGERSFVITNAMAAATASPAIATGTTRRRGRARGARASDCCEAKVSLSMVAAVGGRSSFGPLGRRTT